MSPRHYQQDVPSLTCHACGYDMHDRKQDDPCPECSTQFDPRPDAYTKRWKLVVPLVLSTIGILVMPFTAIFAFIFVIPSFLMVNAHKRISHEYRTPLWAMKSLNQNQMVIRIAFAEFVAMLVISSFWPNAFNWW